MVPPSKGYSYIFGLYKAKMAFILKEFKDGHQTHTVERNEFLKELYSLEDGHQEKFHGGKTATLPRNPILGECTAFDLLL